MMNNKNKNSGSKTAKPLKKTRCIPEKNDNEEDVFNIRKNTNIKLRTISRNVNNISESVNSKELEYNNNTITEIPNATNRIINIYTEAKQFMQNNNIVISTISLDCKLHTLIDIDNFAKIFMKMKLLVSNLEIERILLPTELSLLLIVRKNQALKIFIIKLQY
jgi:hypothetical protein